MKFYLRSEELDVLCVSNLPDSDIFLLLISGQHLLSSGIIIDHSRQARGRVWPDYRYRFHLNMSNKPRVATLAIWKADSARL